MGVVVIVKIAHSMMVWYGAMAHLRPGDASANLTTFVRHDIANRGKVGGTPFNDVCRWRTNRSCNVVTYVGRSVNNLTHSNEITNLVTCMHHFCPMLGISLRRSILIRLSAKTKWNIYPFRASTNA